MKAIFLKSLGGLAAAALMGWCQLEWGAHGDNDVEAFAATGFNGPSNLFMLPVVTEDVATEVQIPVKQSSTAQGNKTAFNPLPLDHEWCRWIVGKWVGTGKSNAGTGRGAIRVELALNGQFLMFSGEAEVVSISDEQRQYLKTQLHAADEEIERFKAAPYRGLEIYTIDQKTGEVVGYLFDSLRCMATGRGEWTADTQTMRWQWATGHKSTRITKKLDKDRLSMVERIAMPDGSTMEESGEMVREK